MDQIVRIIFMVLLELLFLYDLFSFVRGFSLLRHNRAKIYFTAQIYPAAICAFLSLLSQAAFWIMLQNELSYVPLTVSSLALSFARVSLAECLFSESEDWVFLGFKIFPKNVMETGLIQKLSKNGVRVVLAYNKLRLVFRADRSLWFKMKKVVLLRDNPDESAL